MINTKTNWYQPVTTRYAFSIILYKISTRNIQAINHLFESQSLILEIKLKEYAQITKMISVNWIFFVFILFCKINQNVQTESRAQRFTAYTPFNTGLGVG